MAYVRVHRERIKVYEGGGGGGAYAIAGHNVAFGFCSNLRDGLTHYLTWLSFLRSCDGFHFERYIRKNLPTLKLLAHCGRELFHGCWRLILDDGFIHAYDSCRYIPYLIN